MLKNVSHVLEAPAKLTLASTTKECYRFLQIPPVVPACYLETLVYRMGLLEHRYDCGFSLSDRLMIRCTGK